MTVQRVEQVLMLYIPESQPVARGAVRGEVEAFKLPGGAAAYKRDFSKGNESAELGLLRAGWARGKSWVAIFSCRQYALFDQPSGTDSTNS